ADDLDDDAPIVPRAQLAVEVGQPARKARVHDAAAHRQHGAAVGLAMIIHGWPPRDRPAGGTCSRTCARSTGRTRAVAPASPRRPASSPAPVARAAAPRARPHRSRTAILAAHA